MTVNVTAFLILAAVVVVLILVVTSGSRRTPGDQRSSRLCTHCGETQPGHARFCRRCGKQL